MIVFSSCGIPQGFTEVNGITQVVKLDLSSYVPGNPILSRLIGVIADQRYIPENVALSDCTGPEFDLAYHSAIMNDPESFIQFMSIMVPAYMSPETLVVVNFMKGSQFVDSIVESIVKLIQLRYGYSAYITNEDIDFSCVEESDLSIPGLFMLDEDLARWRQMVSV